MKAENKKIVSPREKEYLYKFLRREGMNKIYKYRNAPEIILTAYEKCLSDNNKTFVRPGTQPQRLAIIISHINYIVNTYPKYRKFLKIHNLQGWQVGLLLGYKNSQSFHASYKKYQHITFLVNIISMHEAKLQEMK